MNSSFNSIFVTRDPGLLNHWRLVYGVSPHAGHSEFTQIERLLHSVPKLPCVIWVDTSIPQMPIWSSEVWREMMKSDFIRIVAASSNPNDGEAMDSLDAGCVGYCHAFADVATLQKVREVVESGQVWIGKSLMSRLLRNVKRLSKTLPIDGGLWREKLTPREIEVSILAANGASNLVIASQCSISERTVKAHLSAVFDKIKVSDRLQLALRVHGIQ
jgi:DNA-binding NarL/FixJ family response regulator